MINYKDLQEKGICWTGYKRKKGTKPYEDGSCVKEAKDALGHGSEKHHVLAFGRMNPITSGHEAVVNKVHEIAKKHNATHSVIVSHSQDAKKNPLTGEQKVTHAKNAFPGTNVSSASKHKPTILHHAAAAHAAGAENLHVVAGSDRREEMHNLLHKYNGKDSAHGHYNFKSITVHSSGERDPDAEGTTGISASKMREHAASGNKAAFHAGAPTKMKPEHKDAMYNDVRKGMNIKEETLDQQADHAKQLKRFKDQMSQANGPQKETATELDNLEKEIMLGTVDAKHGLMHNPDPSIDSNVRVTKIKQMTEKLEPSMGASAYINDFISSTNPMFNNKSKEERRKMAIGAYMAAKAKLKEGAMQQNGTDQIDTTTSAPTASTAKDTTMGKKIKGFKFFNGQNEQQMNQPVKEEVLDEASTTINQQAGSDRAFDVHHKESGKHIGTVYTPGRTNPNHVASVNGSDGRPLHSAEFKSFKDAHAFINKSHNIKEAKDNKEYGYEGEMALNQLETLTRCAEMIKDMLKPDTDLPEWVQSKITLATDYIQTAADYLYSESEVKEGYYEKPASAYRRKGDEVKDNTPVAPVPDRKYIKGTPEHKAYKATKKPINGMPTNEEVLDEKSDQAKQNKTMKNMMDASRGAKYKLNNPVPDAEPEHKTARAHNVAIGRALRNEATAQKHVNVDKVNHAGDEPHEEKWEPAPKNVSKLKKEETMKSYKEFLQSLDEKLIGKQHKIDKNKNNKIDAHDFELLRKEEAEKLDEIEFDKTGRYVHKGTYGSSYNPKPGHEETPDDEKAEKKAAGRKTGQTTGSYKPRKTMSKLKSAGATYK